MQEVIHLLKVIQVEMLFQTLAVEVVVALEL
jgi:hypothetical protein